MYRIVLSLLYIPVCVISNFNLALDRAEMDTTEVMNWREGIEKDLSEVHRRGIDAGSDGQHEQYTDRTCT